MSDRLNGLKSQVQLPPLSLSMVRTPLGPPPLDGGPVPPLLEQDAASRLSAATTPSVIRRLMLRPFGECSARHGCPPRLSALAPGGRPVNCPAIVGPTAYRRRSCQEPSPTS